MQLALSDFELFQNQQLPGKNLHTALNDEDDNDDEADRSGKSYFLDCFKQLNNWCQKKLYNCEWRKMEV